VSGAGEAPGLRARRALEALTPHELRRAVAAMARGDRAALASDWPAWAHEGQLAPAGDWRVWVMLAGRGFGKTRAGAEWVSQVARETPGAAIALVAATAGEARALMVEGRSGLLAVARPEERSAMRWEPSRKRLVFASGAEAFLLSGGNPEGLRGPEHHFAWCDELAKWRHGQAAWDNLWMGLRLGAAPRAVVTTTPRAVPALKAILAETRTARTGGPSWANPALSADAVDGLIARHGGTRWGRQELEGALVEDVEGALWSWVTIEAARLTEAEAAAVRGSLRRVVVGVDPPASVGGNACGIVVCGQGADGMLYVLADCSVAGASPAGWSARVAAAAEAWGADRVVAEANNGGDMVEAVLKAAGAGLPVRLVKASRGKAARAEPVAHLFESRQAKLARRFPALEAELAGLTLGGGYQGPGQSPDRADACVWAMTALMTPLAEPRVRSLG
jgi:phage terminase large subunit-like protein